MSPAGLPHPPDESPYSPYARKPRVFERRSSYDAWQMIRCPGCCAWGTMQRSGWKSQNKCSACGRLAYVYPMHRTERDAIKAAEESAAELEDPFL